MSDADLRYRFVIEVEKLRDYFLNPQHPIGKHKAVVAESALGLTQSDWSWLRKEMLDTLDAQPHVFRVGRVDDFGRRLELDMRLQRGDREAVLRTVWLLEPSRTLRLVTLWIV